MSRTSVLCPFYQTNPERGAPSVDVIAQSRMGAIRALHIQDMPSNPMPDKEIHARLYTVGDDGEMALMWQGAEGARKYFEMCKPNYDRLKALGIRHVSGGNEPHPQTLDQLKAANAFQVRLAELVGNYGMHYWAWDWGVGWPDYGLARHWVESVRVARQTGGGLCVHLYGAPDVFENQHYPDADYALRVRHQIRELYDAGLAPGERWVIIGECGIDGGVIDWEKPPFEGQRRRRGWRDWADWVYVTPRGHRIMDERYYWERLSAYDDVLTAIPEIRWAFVFLAHPTPDWADFTLTQYLLDQMAAKHGFGPAPAPEPPPAPDPEPPAEGYYLPSNDPLTLDAIASGDVYQMYVKRRWWNEHAVRLLDAGDVAQARAVLRDMADRERGLDYVIERALQ